MHPYISRDGCYYTDTDSIVLPTGGSVIKAIINTEVAGKRLAISMVVEARLSEKEEVSSRALRMFIEQSHDEVYGCLKGGSGNSGGKRLAISMVEEAWLSEKKEV
ncbi:hypothetical protein Tco_0827273 [Tanacetum coccineum]